LGSTNRQDLLRLLGSTNRLRIVERLVAGECSVKTLEAELAIRQPTLSQQLGELRKAGLVIDRREAQSVHYSMAPDHIEQVQRVLSALNGADAQRSHKPKSETRPVHAAQFGRVLSD